MSLNFIYFNFLVYGSIKYNMTAILSKNPFRVFLLFTDYRHLQNSAWNIVHKPTSKKMASVQNFEVMSDKINVDRICVVSSTQE
jgi:hypothetical protein